MDTLSQLNLSEIPIKPNSKFKGYPLKPNGISFWAFLLSIFIYISIFYVFNLSPTSLFNTTKFWFFISNTLILIIAADFGTFSSSRKRDLYEEEHAKKIQARSVPSLEFHYQSFVNKKDIFHQNMENSQEEIKEIVVVPERTIQLNSTQSCLVGEEKSEENKLAIVVKNDPKKLEFVPKVDNEAPKEKNKAKYARSNSEKATKVENDEKKILRRSQTEKLEEKPNVEDNEFSNMSDEELNRRVEEFIQKFNRQIRLQAAARKKFHHL